MKRFSKWLFYLALFPAALGFCGWQGWSWWSWASSPVAASEMPAGDSATAAPAPAAKSTTIEVPQGTSATQIGDLLKQAGLIRSTDAWSLWVRWQGLQNREGGFQAGLYEISPTESLPAIAEKIWTGDVMQRSFTIPEGWSISQMADYFAEQGFFTKEEFIAATQQIPRDRYPWLPPNIPQLEGFLYPDTYKLPATEKPQAQVIVNQMLDRFQQVALPVYQQAQGKTRYSLQEWVTLASIVEREAVIGSERPQIASVFAKRLRENMPLGADPTVEYALGIRQTPDQPLTFAQVETPSPYNTYINVGLPPTPISSPGVSSLQASLNPADTEYLYFVARYDGTHVFSKTLAEHEAAQDAIHDNREAQPQPGTASPAPAAPSASPAANPTN